VLGGDGTHVCIFFERTVFPNMDMKKMVAIFGGLAIGIGSIAYAENPKPEPVPTARSSCEVSTGCPSGLDRGS
jgi:hypothetical protein